MSRRRARRQLSRVQATQANTLKGPPKTTPHNHHIALRHFRTGTHSKPLNANTNKSYLQCFNSGPLLEQSPTETKSLTVGIVRIVSPLATKKQQVLKRVYSCQRNLFSVDHMLQPHQSEFKVIPSATYVLIYMSEFDSDYMDSYIFLLRFF